MEQAGFGFKASKSQECPARIVYFCISTVFISLVIFVYGK